MMTMRVRRALLLSWLFVGCSGDGNGEQGTGSGGTAGQGTGGTGASGAGPSPSSGGSGTSGTPGNGGTPATGGSGNGGAPGGAAGSGGAAGASGTAGGGGAAGGGSAGTPAGWPTYEQAAASPLSTPMLVILTDFKDSEIGSYLPNPDVAWAGLMFGRKQAQANNYWYEITRGSFQLIPAKETFGVANDGVVHVHLSSTKPTSGKFVVQNEAWIAEALDLAAQSVKFADYDKDHDGHITNRELSVLLPLNLDYANINGAGAESNIPFGKTIAGTGITLDKFARVEDDYTSIGTPSHELGHHVFGLKHTVSPTTHDLMGLGAYAEDPVITTLHTTTNHYATRPTGLMARHQVEAGLVKPVKVADTMKGVKLWSSHRLEYNVLEVPVQDGFVYLENRTAEGYDQSIPFCNMDKGGVFPTEVSQYVAPLDIPAIASRANVEMFDEPEDSVCDIYALGGHNDSFSLGQYTISNFSAAGPEMTMDITRRAITPAIDHYMLRYWVINPNKAGYRMFHSVKAPANGTLDVDFAAFPSGNDATAYFTISLNAYYNTGEVRSVNGDATWTSSSTYVSPTVNPINLDMPKSDAIVVLKFDPTATKQSTVTWDVKHAAFATKVRFVNVP